MRFLFCCLALLYAFSALGQVLTPHQTRPRAHVLQACHAPTRAARRLHARLAQEAAVAFLRDTPDTVWLMESVGFDDARPVGRVWTRTGQAGYSYDPNTQQFHFAEQPFFPHHIGLVQRWDSAALHAERGLGHTPGYGLANGTRSIRATRMVRRGKRVECHAFFFLEVISLTRDLRGLP